jgi:hypothetical protein
MIPPVTVIFHEVSDGPFERPRACIEARSVQARMKREQSSRTVDR